MAAEPKAEKKEEKPIEMVNIIKKDGSRQRQCAKSDLKSYQAAGYLTQAEFDKKSEA